MIVKVLKPFRDKETMSILRPGLIVDFAEERVEGLASTLNPFVEIVEEEIEEGPENTIEVEEGELVLPDFETKTKADIVNFAKDVMDIELDMKMTKAEMIKLLEK